MKGKFKTKRLGYDRRKLKVLKYISNLKRPARINDLMHNFKLNYHAAAQLLWYYYHQDLLTRRSRGRYGISKEGERRIEYFEARLDLERTTGIYIGLNHHKDHRLEMPFHQILARYREITGKSSPLVLSALK